MKKINNLVGIVLVGQVSCAAPLSEKLKHLEYGTTHSEQIAAIRQFSSDCQFDAIPKLISLLRTTQNTQITNELLLALGQMRAYEALPAIKEIVDKKDEFFKQSLAAMAQIGTSASVDYVLYKLSDPDPSIRITVLSALKYAPDYQIISKIADALIVTDSNVGVHQEADNLTYRINVSRCKARFVEENLYFPAATELLRSLQTQEIDILIKKITDVSLPGAESAKAIADLEELPRYQNHPRFSEVLLNALLDNREEVRLAALSLQRLVRDHNALPIVHNLLRDPSSKVRAAAFSVAAAIGNNTTLDNFYEIANSPKNKSKLMAIQHIGLFSKHTRSKYGLSLLEKLAVSSDSPTAFLATEELRKLRDELAKHQTD